jgi:hypothetical protein
VEAVLYGRKWVVIEPWVKAEWKRFRMCKEFHCLPEHGGWNDQHPIIRDIFSEIQKLIDFKEYMDSIKPRSTAANKH